MIDVVCQSDCMFDQDENAIWSCPSSHPFAMANGDKCCRSSWRDSTCSQGQGQLLYTDPEDSCQENVILDCPGSTCEDNQNAKSKILIHFHN